MYGTVRDWFEKNWDSAYEGEIRFTIMFDEFAVFSGAWLSLECASVFLLCLVYLVGFGSDAGGYVIVLE